MLVGISTNPDHVRHFRRGEVPRYAITASARAAAQAKALAASLVRPVHAGLHFGEAGDPIAIEQASMNIN